MAQSTNRRLVSDANYSFIYVVHPLAVTGFSWRHTSKYMHRYSYLRSFDPNGGQSLAHTYCLLAPHEFARL